MKSEMVRTAIFIGAKSFLVLKIEFNFNYT